MTDNERHTNSEHVPSGGLPSERESETQQSNETMIQHAKPRVASFVKTLFVAVLVAFFLKIFVVEAFRIPSGSMENTLLIGDFLLVNKLAYGLKTPRYVPFTNLHLPAFRLPLFRGVRHGDVVVFEFPGKHSGQLPSGPEYYIKRCIGLPGDTISIHSGYVTVNGREVLLPSHAKPSTAARTIQVDASALGHLLRTAIDPDNFGPTVVPKKGDVIHLTPSSVALWEMFIEREGHDVEVSPLGAIMVDGAAASDYVVEQDYYFMLGDNRGNSLDSRYWGFVPDDHVLGEALLLYWSRASEHAGSESQDRSENIRWNRIGMLIR